MTIFDADYSSALSFDGHKLLDEAYFRQRRVRCWCDRDAMKVIFSKSDIRDIRNGDFIHVLGKLSGHVIQIEVERDHVVAILKV